MWHMWKQDRVYSEDSSVCDEVVDAGARGDAHSSSDAVGVDSTTTGASTLDVDGVTGSTDPLNDKKGLGVGGGGGATTTGGGATTTTGVVLAS
jgi:hypothetical protein